MSDTITRLNSALADRYVVEKEIGAGGMATVFLADDLKHNRKVAIKVLRPDLAAVVGAERFFSEIETTAQLQHPNILPLFDSGEADGLLFYAMPFVEGETLAARLKREQQLPVDHALDIARKISAALDYAHQRGIVHRDVKPANILLSSGEPLVADFGIALAVTQAGDGRITETGLSLGTPHYMSPEQASGDRSLDPRSDVYAVGCVLYEMLVGEPPFPGPTPQSVLARILTSTPNRVSSIRPTVPPHVDAAIARSLEKLPADRFESVGDFKKAIDDPSFTHVTAATGAAAVLPAVTARSKAPGKSRALMAALGVTLVVAAVGWLREGPPQPVYRFTIDLPVGSAFGPDIAISPDGSRLAYVGVDGSIHTRPLSSVQSQVVPGTESARIPYFSPDGNGLGVNLPGDGGDATYTVNLNGSSPIRIGDRIDDTHPGGAWSEDGYVYFTGVVDRNEALLRAPAQGGASEIVPADLPVFWVAALPGSGSLLVGADFSEGNDSDPGLAVLDVATGEIRPISGVSGSLHGRVAGGYLFWVGFDAILMAAPFDPAGAALTGPSVVLGQGVQMTGNGSAEVAVSDNGTLIYQVGFNDGTGVGETPGWIDRSGSTTVINSRFAGDIGDFDYTSLSPDGRHIALEVQLGGDRSSDLGWQVQVYDIEQETLSPLTFEGQSNRNPRWMADGRIAYVSDQGEGFGIYAQPSDRSGTDELLFQTEHEIWDFDTGPEADSPFSVSLLPDSTATLAQGIYAVTPSGDGVMRPVVATRFFEGGARVSPDGNWVVYISDEAGQPEIYVRAFPSGGRPYSISTEGGVAPAWGPNGDEIFFSDLDQMMILAELDVSNGISVRQRRPLFDAGPFEIGGGATYDVAPDGRILAVLEPSAQRDSAGRSSQVRVVINVFEDIRRRVEAAGR